MAPVHRHHDGVARVPVALLDAVESLFGPEASSGPDWGMWPEEIDALAVVLRTEHSTDGHVEVDAAAFSRFRNTLDGFTLSYACESEDTGPDIPIGVTCDFCMWCQSLILRDWSDETLDRSGHRPPPYILPAPPGSDVEATYRQVWVEVQARYAAPGC